ncbi:hypothetical protein KI387_007425 [Taxus chinensis]|uniref:DUF868 family protein n=1 Tax=Taxus chinensis TaxID=29808 RepID=A0AA38LN20_TAXCH|nr:hypothetical protein KI387_007425 [Taxus chinensis]
MPETPSCFGKSNVRSFEKQNLVACTYQANLGGHYRVITVTWCRNSFTISVGDRQKQSTCRVDLRPWRLRRKQGSKRLRVDGAAADAVDVFWDLTSAKFFSCAEPKQGYCLAVVYDEEAVLLLGDMKEKALRKTKSRAAPCEAVLLSRKEHVFGKQCFATTARFGDGGRSHEVGIECHTNGSDDPVLCISVDKETVVEVKRLVWKFRGNDTIYVEGSPVQILWDVHDWLFGPGFGHAVFLFRSAHEVDDKLMAAAPVAMSVDSRDAKFCLPSDFCLLLYAWKCD